MEASGLYVDRANSDLYVGEGEEYPTEKTRFSVITDLFENVKRFISDDRNFLAIEALGVISAVILASTGHIYLSALLVLGLVAEDRRRAYQNHLDGREKEPEGPSEAAAELYAIEKYNILDRQKEVLQRAQDSFNGDRKINKQYFSDFCETLLTPVSQLKKNFDDAGIFCPKISRLKNELLAKQNELKESSNPSMRENLIFFNVFFKKLWEIYDDLKV